MFRFSFGPSSGNIHIHRTFTKIIIPTTDPLFLGLITFLYYTIFGRLFSYYSNGRQVTEAQLHTLNPACLLCEIRYVISHLYCPFIDADVTKHVVDTVVYLLHILEVPVSNMHPETSCPG
jgi:hypothetical protein